MSPATIYTIESDLLAAFDTLDMLDGPDDAELRAELEADIARLVAMSIKKVDGVARMMGHFENQVDFADLELKRIGKLKKCMQGHYDRLEACVRLAMEISGKSELKGETSKLALRLNPPSVFIRDFNSVPAEFCVIKTETSHDKAAIKRAIQGGMEVPGAELVQGDRLVRR